MIIKTNTVWRVYASAFNNPQTAKLNHLIFNFKWVKITHISLIWLKKLQVFMV